MEKVIAILPSIALYGKERSNIEVYKLIQDCGFDISVVINKNAPEKLIKELATLRTLNVRIPSRTNAKFKFIKYFLSLVLSNISLGFILFRSNPSIILVCNEMSFYDFFPLLFFYKGKIVYRLGDSPAFPKLSNKLFNQFLWKQLVCKRVHTIVCISEFIRDQLKKYGRNSMNDLVIYNVPPTRCHLTNNKLEKKSNKITFGYLGQVTFNKGVHLFFQAAIELLKKRDDVTFVIAGNLDYDKAYLQNYLSEYMKFNNIQFLGEIDDVDSFFESIDVLVVPSIYEEPLGNVIVEAKKAGKPCVIFNSGGMPELIRHGIDGFVCQSKTALNLQSGIEYYLFNKEQISIHGKRAGNSIKELGISKDSFTKKWKRILGVA